MPTLVFPAPGFTSSTQFTTAFNGFDLAAVTGSTATNLLRYSNNFTVGAWTVDGGTNVSRDLYGTHTVSAQSVGLNYYIDYSATSDIFVSTNISTVTQLATVKPNTTYTFSFYTKAGTSTNLINYRVYDNTNSAEIVAPTEYNTGLITSVSSTVFSPSASTTINLPVPYFNTYSASFGGTNYIYETSASYAATGNFTIEGWFYFTGSSQNTILCIGNEATGRIVFFQDGTTNNLSYNIYGNLSVTLTAATVANQVWTHIAIVRTGTSLTTYVNGMGGTPLTLSGTLGNSSGAYIMGSPAGIGQGSGLISNLRYVKGTAVYASNFTPSKVNLTAVTNTQLLLFQTANALKDNSSNNYTIQQGGAAVGTFNGNISTLYVGMQVSGTNISANTVISSIVGMTINLNFSTTAGMGNTVTFTDSRWKRISTTFTTNGTCTSVAVQPFYATTDITGNILIANTQLEVGSTATNPQITLGESYAAASATQQITYSTIKYSTVSKVIANSVMRTVSNIIRSGAVKSRAKLREDTTTRVIGQLRKPIEIIRLVPLSKTSTVNFGTSAGKIEYKWPAKTSQVFHNPSQGNLSKPIEIIKLASFNTAAGTIKYKWPAKTSQVFHNPSQGNLSKPIEIIRLVPLSKTSTVNFGTSAGKIEYKWPAKTSQVFHNPSQGNLSKQIAIIKNPAADDPIRRPVNAIRLFKYSWYNSRVSYTPTSSKLSQFPVGPATGDFELAVTGKTPTSTNNLLNFYLDYSVTSDTLVSTPKSNATTTLYFARQLVLPFDIGSNIFVISATTTTNGNLINQVIVTACTNDSVSFNTPAWVIPDGRLTVKSGATVYSQILVRPTTSRTGLARDNFYWFNLNPYVRANRTAGALSSGRVTNSIINNPLQGNLDKPVEVVKSLNPIVLPGKMVSNARLRSDNISIRTNSPDLMTNWKSLIKGSTNTAGATNYNATVVSSLIGRPTNAIENLFYFTFLPAIRQDRYQTSFSTGTLPTNNQVTVFSAQNSSKLSQFPVGPATGDFELAVTGKTPTSTNNLLNFYLDYSTTSDILVSTPISNATTTLYFSPQSYIPFDIGSNIFVISATTTTNGNLINQVIVTACTNDSVSFNTPAWVIPASGITVKSGATVYSQILVRPLSSHTGLARDNFYWFNLDPYVRANRTAGSLTSASVTNSIITNPLQGSLAKPIEVVKDLTIRLLSGKANSINRLKADNAIRVSGSLQKPIEVVKNPTPLDALVLDPAQLRKPIEVVKNPTPLDALVLDPYTITKLKVPANNAQVFRTPSTDKLRAVSVLKGLPNTSTVFDSAQLQKPIEVVKNPTPLDALVLDPYTITKLKVPANNAQVFRTPSTDKLRAVSVLAGLRTLLDTVSITKLKVTANNAQIFDTPVNANLSKAIEVVKGLPNTSFVFDLPKLRALSVLKGLPNTSTVFDSAQLQKPIEVVKGLPNTSFVFDLPKLRAALVLNGLRTLLDTVSITKLKVTANNAQIFDTPVNANLSKAIEVVKNPTPLDALVLDPAQLQKPIEVVKGLPNTSFVFDLPKLQAITVLRSDRNLILSGRTTAITKLKNSTPADSLVFNTGNIIKIKNYYYFVAFDVGTNTTYKLSQFPPDEKTKGDYVLNVIGRNPTTTNNLLNFYLDYSTTSDTLVSTPIPPTGTTTFYFAQQYGLPFTIGSIIKVFSVRENTARYVVVTGSTNSSVSFDTPAWPLLDSGYTVESGATVYNQYSANPTSSHTGLARDNFYWFNLDPYIRSDRISTSAGISNSIVAVSPSQGSLAKPIEVIKDLVNNILTGKVTSGFVLRSDKTTLTISQLQKPIEVVKNPTPLDALVLDPYTITKLKVPANNAQIFDAPVSNKLRSMSVVRGLPNTSTVFDSAQLQKPIEVVRDAAALLKANQLQKSIEVVKGLPNTSFVFDLPKLRAVSVLKGDKTSLTIATLQKTLKISYTTTEVFETPGSANLNKAIEVVKGLPNTSFVFDLPNLRAVSVLRGLPNTSTVFDSAQLQKAFESLRSVSTILLVNNLPNERKIRNNQVFFAPSSSNLSKPIEVIKDLVNNILTGKVTSGFVLRSDKTTLVTSQLQKPIEAVKGLPNTSFVFDLPKLRAVSALRGLETLLDTRLITKLKVPANNAQIFDAPVNANLTKAIELIRGDRATLTTSQLQKPIEVVKNPTPLDALVLDPYTITKLKVPANNAQVFSTPSTDKLRAVSVLRGLPNTSTVFDSAQLQKPIEVVKGLPNTSFVFDLPKLRAISVLRGDRNVIRSGQAKSVTKLKNPTPLDSLVYDSEYITKYRFPYTEAQVWSVSTEVTELSLFPPDGTNKGDFVLNVIGRNPLTRNNLLNFYLDYSTTSDILVSTPISNATTTLYFSPQSYIPFDIGSMMKITSVLENTVRYVTVTGSTKDSVSFNTPSWRILDSGYTVESGATVYNQYSARPTSSHTGLARDNFYWFNLDPYVRANRDAGNLISSNITNSIITNPLQGSLAKPIEVIKDLVNNILTGKVTSGFVLRSDKTRLLTSQLQKSIEVVKNPTPLDALVLDPYTITKLKVPANNAQVFSTPESSKLKSVNRLISDSVKLNIGLAKRGLVVRDTGVKPALADSPDLMTNWKSITRGSTNTVRSTVYNASFVSLTTKPTNAIENLFYAMFLPSIRQDRYQTNFNTFTLNPIPPILQSPGISKLTSVSVLTGDRTRLLTAQLQKPIEVVKGLPNTSFVFDLPKLRAISKLADPYIFKTQNTLLRDIIKVREDFFLLFLEDNQGKVISVNLLKDVAPDQSSSIINQYDTKITSLTTRPTTARENFYYANSLPSIRQDRYQTNFNTFTLYPDNRVISPDTTPYSLQKPIVIVRSIKTVLTNGVFENPLRFNYKTTQVFDTPGVSQLQKSFEKIKAVPDARVVGRAQTVSKLGTALVNFNQTGKTLLRDFLRDIPVSLDYLSMKKYKVNKGEVQVFDSPAAGLVTRFKTGTLYGIGIADPTFRKQEPIQFWN